METKATPEEKERALEKIQQVVSWSKNKDADWWDFTIELKEKEKKRVCGRPLEGGFRNCERLATKNSAFCAVCNGTLKKQHERRLNAQLAEVRRQTTRQRMQQTKAAEKIQESLEELVVFMNDSSATDKLKEALKNFRELGFQTEKDLLKYLGLNVSPKKTSTDEDEEEKHLSANLDARLKILEDKYEMEKLKREEVEAQLEEQLQDRASEIQEWFLLLDKTHSDQVCEEFNLPLEDNTSESFDRVLLKIARMDREKRNLIQKRCKQLRDELQM